MDCTFVTQRISFSRFLAALLAATALVCSPDYSNAATNRSIGETTQIRELPVSGVVLDAKGQPVAGANVIEKGTTNGMMTDMAGKFSLTVKEGAELEISFIGYTTQSLPARGSMRIVLAEDSEFLKEVVVVGYGSQKKVDLTGAVANVGSEAFENRTLPNVTQALQGAIPNLNLTLED